MTASLLFSLLLRLFPRRFREEFGGEMREVFEAQHRAAGAEGPRAIVRLWYRTITGMIVAAARERRAPRERRRARLPWYDTLLADARLACRLLLRAPLFSLIVVATIAVGVGGVATIFSALNALVLRPLPGTVEGARLFGIERRTPDGREGVSASYAFYRHLAVNARTLDGVAAWSRVALSLSHGGRGFAVSGNIVSGNYFSVLGVRPAAGRFFVPGEDDAPLARPAIVVSHAFWKGELGGDPSVVGEAVRVNGREYRLVGVAPEGFRGVFTPLEIDAWVPLAMQPHVRPGRDLGLTPWLWVFGRLQPRVTDGQARGEVSALAASWVQSSGEDPIFRDYTSLRLTPLTGLPDDARRALLAFGGVLLGAATLVMLIAGANVSSLLAARAVARRREIGVRVALGATRGRVVGHLLTETLLLFLLGACGAALISWGATGALERLPLPADGTLSLELSPDGRVLAVSAAAALVIGVIFGVGPALRGVGRAPGALLRATSAGAGRRTVVSSLMIAGQVACSMLLLTSAGLFLRSIAAGTTIDPLLDPRGVVVASFNTEAFGYDETAGRAFYEQLRRRLEQAPGVERVSLGTFVPLTFADSGGVARIDAAEANAPRELRVRDAAVDPGYLDVLGIPLVDGRDFTPADATAAPAAIVNETFVRRAWPEGGAVGRSFTFGGRRLTVVGVARDSRYARLDEPPLPFVYLALSQRWTSARTVFVRGRGRVVPPISVIPNEALAIDPALPPPAVSTLAHEMTIVLLPQRVAAMVTSLLGGAGLLLAAVGLYGLVAYAVNLRTREIGVRMALGAGAASVVRLVLSRGMRLIAAGTAIGLAASLLATRLLASYLLTVSPLDPAAFAAAIAVLIGVTAAASYIPARRAARVSPLEAMRE